MGVVVEGLESLDLLKGKVLAFQKVLDQAIIVPRLQTQSEHSPRALLIDGITIRILAQQTDRSAGKLFSDVHAVVNYLDTHLPQSVSRPLLENLIPSLVSRLLGGSLASSVPPDLDGIPTFQSTLKTVLAFAKFSRSRNWRGQQDLVKWAEDAPKVWLARRSESSLHSIRQLLKRGLGNKRAVERAETQMVTRKDEMFAGNGNQDDWDAGWSDDGEEEKLTNTIADKLPSTNKVKDDEQDDTSAWGFDEDDADDAEHEKIDDPPHTDADAEDGGEAWGWGEDDDNGGLPTSSRRPYPLNDKRRQDNRHQEQATTNTQSEREVTLRETYHITALPEQILEMIIQVVDDADYLSRPK